MPATLPEFDAPPVGEVVLSVQFRKIRELNTVRLGQLWGEFREAFPKTQQKTPIDRVVETFDEHSLYSGDARFSFVNDDLIPRVWFLNENESELVQAQPDRFLRNWIRKNEAEYPRYGHVKDEFFAAYEIFLQYLNKESLPQPAVDQCEVTYINYIDVSGESPWDLSQLLKHIDHPQLSENLKFEGERVELKHIIQNHDGNNIGRLYVKCYPALRKSTNTPIIRMDLTARGAIGDEELTRDQISEFFDFGHETIVQSFTDLTSENMHELWGRTQ